MAAGWGLMEAGGAIIGANLRELASTSPHQEEGMRVMGARTKKLASTWPQDGLVGAKFRLVPDVTILPKTDLQLQTANCSHTLQLSLQ